LIVREDLRIFIGGFYQFLGLFIRLKSKAIQGYYLFDYLGNSIITKMVSIHSGRPHFFIGLG
jgi:hypothetical protein